VDEKFKTAYAALAKDKSQREALASLIVEYIDPGHITENIVGLFLDTRALKPGDALVKKVRTGIDVRTLVPGSVHLASEITVADRINYMLDGADVKVRANLWELESGELGTVESIRAEMQATLTDFYVGRVFTALANIWTAVNTPNNYVAVANLTQAALRNAINEINYRIPGGVRAVVGTRRSLAPITQFGGFHVDPVNNNAWGNEDAIREIYRTGWLGSWYGANIVAIDQVWSDQVTYTPMISNRYVVVLGNHVGEFITYGDAKWKQWEDMAPTPPDWYLELYQQFGMIIDKAIGIYVIDCTALAGTD